ncbi:amidohydrolase [[Actinomadura] parvosata subsp. kistnae]|uniref:Amidohydrolase n=1 Tax=[Actinomadura] parvosata subsp. kistnae TaxID=1909395 RepID=A0A1V0A5C0_9ACTN|nr:amidohydrolase family protein [Nonomuraea sp. ATCC 55076]AQZ65400.1 amidohydrolase [Nonomuraea sp. ATCC 55076]SPL96730.1 amidohydrolase [Actinomadura parvosata subsp. kistnae]
MRTLIRNVRVFDGERTVPGADVLIDGDRIAEPGDVEADVEVDGAGRTLLPGLIDAHTHAFDGDLAEALRFGVTTELDLNNLPPILAAQRRLAAERDDVADLRGSGMIATAPGGHPTQIMTPDLLRALGSDTGLDTVADAGQAKAFVEARLAEGADYLKIAVDDGSASGLSLPVLSPELAAVLVEAGHAAGLKVIAHTVTAREALIALDAGVDGLAHLYSDVPAEAAEETAARIASYGAFVVSTIVYIEAVTGGTGGGELLRDPRIAARMSDRSKATFHQNPGGPELGDIPMHPAGVVNAAHAAAALLRAGVPVLAGTDATSFGPVHGAAFHRELLLLTEAGLTPEQALAAATSVTARCFGLADRGRIAPGLRADLLLVDGDPTTDITATRAIAGVWRAGVRQGER